VYPEKAPATAVFPHGAMSAFTVNIKDAGLIPKSFRVK
jgi:hypothetical protein